MECEVAGGCLKADDQKRVGNMGLGPAESLNMDCVSFKGYVKLELNERISEETPTFKSLPDFSLIHSIS